MSEILSNDIADKLRSFADIVGFLGEWSLIQPPQVAYALAHEQPILEEAQRSGANSIGRLACLIVSMHDDHERGDTSVKYRAYAETAPQVQKEESDE